MIMKKSNKPDILICGNKKGTCIVIDVAILGDRNIIKKETEKILKYKELITEIQCMWNVKAKMMPVITGATRTISKSLRQYCATYLESMKLRNYKKQLYWKLQKTAILETANILWKVLL
jgi:hypothetical protein